MRANAARDKPASWESSSSVHARQGALCMRPRVRAVCGERTVENQSFAAGEMASAQFAHEVTNKDERRLRTTISLPKFGVSAPRQGRRSVSLSGENPASIPTEGHGCGSARCRSKLNWPQISVTAFGSGSTTFASLIRRRTIFRTKELGRVPFRAAQKSSRTV
jgi:hypothetical protein